MAKRELQIDSAAREALDRLLKLFEDPQSLPAKVAKVFMTVGDRYCSRWSDRNQLIVCLMGASDAATARTWHKRGRYVRKDRYYDGGFNILKPLIRSWTIHETDPETGEEVTRKGSFLYGFQGWRVYAKEETEVTNQELAAKFDAQENVEYISALPWLDVAKAWGVEVNAAASRWLEGSYNPETQGIQLGVQSVAVWAHELIHAAEDQLGKLTKRGQDQEQEIVAELGAQVLLSCAGLEVEADLGGCYEYISHYGGDEALSIAYRLSGRIIDAVGLVLRTAGQRQEVTHA